MNSPEQRKPIDLGNGHVQASFGLDASWLSVGSLHPGVGLLELVGVPELPPANDGDGDAVRAHRVRLTEPAYAVVRFPDVSGTWDSSRSEWSIEGQGWESTAFGWAVGATVVQRHSILTRGPGRLRVWFEGRLARPEYAMITPVGPVPPRLPPTQTRPGGAELVLTVPDQDPPVTVRVAVSSRGAEIGPWRGTEFPLVLDATWDGSDEEVEVDIRVSTNRGLRDDRLESGAEVRPGRPGARKHDLGTLDRIVEGSRRYTRECTAIATGRSTCCIVTDHRLLPLSWTRDAYFQAALLLASDLQHDHDVVRRHLAWLWGPGRDLDGVWQRSHFVTGGVKDEVYQADQQLYPLLELADYRRVTGVWPRPPDLGDGWGGPVRTMWERLPREPGGLVPGAENPADDPAGLPYLLSNQLLLAYAARRLAQWEQELGLQDLRLGSDADGVLSQVRHEFTCEGPFGTQWAYETDGGGRVSLYHDANDVPTALAPLWGLCDGDDPHWVATMRFAWSDRNPGYVPGRHGGLGSRHTAGVWPLGDAQEWAVALLRGDAAQGERVVRRLGQVVSADGMLPETYDPATCEWRARHWFAWPGSLVGLLAATVLHEAGPWISRDADGWTSG